MMTTEDDRAPDVAALARQAQTVVGVLLLVLLAKATLLHPAFYVLIAVLGLALVVGGLAPRWSAARLLYRLRRSHRCTQTATASTGDQR